MRLHVQVGTNQLAFWFAQRDGARTHRLSENRHTEVSVQLSIPVRFAAQEIGAFLALQDSDRRVSGIIWFPLSPPNGLSMAGTRVWRISADGPPGRSGYVPFCVPEGRLVSSGPIASALRSQGGILNEIAAELAERDIAPRTIATGPQPQCATSSKWNKIEHRLFSFITQN